MNIVKKLDQYDEKFVFFCEPIKNNILNDGNFIRIIYSTPNIVLNGVYLLLSFNDITCDKYYNKFRCNFNASVHKEMIEILKNIEENILKKSDIKNKIPQFKINEQLKNGNFKLFSDVVDNKFMNSFILKISGIWITHHNFGLTYKFVQLNHQISTT
jgi:hypothetical protein